MECKGKKKRKRKKRINLFGRTTLNSKLDSEKHHSSNIQVHKASDHHRNCKQVRDYTQSAKSLGRKQASEHKSKRPGQGRGGEKKKNHKYLPTSHQITALQQRIELRPQDFKYIRFPLRETPAPNKAL